MPIESPSPDESAHLPVFDDPMGDEWANTLTHAISCVIATLGLIVMLWLVADKPLGLQASCLVYSASVVGVFLFSTLSHAVYQPRMRQRMRAWDQGMIYTMIAGTYTPFAWAYGDSVRLPLLLFLWILAGLGFASKVIIQHRVDAIGTFTYLFLGWAPALVLFSRVPLQCLAGMALGGVIYSVGVLFLRLDRRRRFFHAVWHLFVLSAAMVHFFTIVKYVVVQGVPAAG